MTAQQGDYRPSHRCLVRIPGSAGTALLYFGTDFGLPDRFEVSGLPAAVESRLLRTVYTQIDEPALAWDSLDPWAPLVRRLLRTEIEIHRVVLRCRLLE